MGIDHVCTEKETLNEIKDELKTLNKKFFQSNGERALVEVIRDNTKGRERLEKKVDDHLGTEGAPVKTVRKLKLGKGGFEITGYTGADLAKIALMIVIVTYMFWNNHGEEMVENIQKARAAEAAK